MIVEGLCVISTLSSLRYSLQTESFIRDRLLGDE
jgi:hypothetical protein